MNKRFSLVELSHAAWHNFCKDWMSWIMLAIGGIILMFASIAIQFYMPEYRQLLSLLLCVPGAVYTAILHQNGLDSVYGRPLNMLSVSPSILFASLFFIAISLYSPFPQYSEYLLLLFPEDFQFLMAINWIIHLAISYLLVRCMFTGMTMLEDKCSVLQAFKTSFQLTYHHILLLLATFFYLAVVLMVSTLTIVGYFVALPYTILLKSFLFKYLREHRQ